MIVFRCTQRVLNRFKLTPVETEAASTGVLGDWYANLLNIGPTRLVLCQSERSLLPVILPARNTAFPQGFGEALGRVLQRLRVRPDLVTREIVSAQDARFAKSRSRQVLGAMNDFAFHARFCLAKARTDDPILEACLMLAAMPSGPIGMESPGRLTLSLFSSPGVN